MTSQREYDDLLSSLYALEAAKGMDFKLERVALALQDLGDPHTQYPVVHIAGTNGKGSTAAMLHSILGAAGERVGLYTSPHLVRFSERIRINQTEIGAEPTVLLAREVHRSATLRGIELTFFEFVTVMAFLHFARERVSIAVVETGLGGRLDATNVVTPEVAVITSVGLDHQEYLGDSIEAIAAEKAGIIKAGQPLVLGVVPPAAHTVIAAAAHALQAPIARAGRDFDMLQTPIGLRFEQAGTAIAPITVAVPGSYQRDNAAVAIAAALRLDRRLQPSSAAIQRGLATVRWPGRLEKVSERPSVWLDGAHNADGVRALIGELPAIAAGRPIHLLFSVMQDKDWVAMVDLLARVVSRATVTVALPRRTADPAKVAARFARSMPAEVIADPLTALESVLASSEEGSMILVCGSLFLVGAVYPYFLRQSGRQGVFESADSALHP